MPPTPLASKRSVLACRGFPESQTCWMSLMFSLNFVLRPKKVREKESNTTVYTSISPSIFFLYSREISALHFAFICLFIFFSFFRNILKTNLLIYIGEIEAASKHRDISQLRVFHFSSCFVSDGESIMCWIYGRVETSDSKKESKRTPKERQKLFCPPTLYTWGSSTLFKRITQLQGCFPSLASFLIELNLQSSRKGALFNLLLWLCSFRLAMGLNSVCHQCDSCRIVKSDTEAGFQAI